MPHLTVDPILLPKVLGYLGRRDCTLGHALRQGLTHLAALLDEQPVRHAPRARFYTEEPNWDGWYRPQPHGEQRHYDLGHRAEETLRDIRGRFHPDRRPRQGVILHTALACLVDEEYMWYEG